MQIYYICNTFFNNLLQNVFSVVSPLNAELNPICHFLALVGAHHILNVSRIRVNYCSAMFRPQLSAIFCLASLSACAACGRDPTHQCTDVIDSRIKIKI